MKGADVLDPMKQLEDALVLCKFGRFHLRLLLVCLVSNMATTVATTTASYVVTNAECQLGIGNVEKGLFISTSFFGQLLTTPLAGIASDAFGRRPFLIFGNLFMAIFCLLQGLSQSFWMLMLMKLGEGMASGFSINLVGTMLAECTNKNVRDRIMVAYVTFFPMGQIIVVLFAWAILPRELDVVLWKGYFEIHSWQLFLFTCTIWGLLASIQFYCLPESPKYTLAQDKPEEALEIIKKIFSENTGSDKDTFPIKSLTGMRETDTVVKASVRKQLTMVVFNIKYLFRKPLVGILCLVCLMNTMVTAFFSTIRMWNPQMLTIIENYESTHVETTRFCVMIDEYYVQKNSQVMTSNITNIVEEACVSVISGSSTYKNILLISAITTLIIGSCVFLVKYFTQKQLISVSLTLCVFCSVALHFIRYSVMIAATLGFTTSLSIAAFSFLNNITIRVFPTSIRSSAVAVNFTFCRLSSVVGNIVFPLLIQYRCIVPFTTLTVGIGVAAFLSFFLPDPSKDNKDTGDR
ncbi:unnamed protein product [Plutella xylostella]|uniref:(diamondback moth) hypothetical protein n=1 Tax=Plutella xylostella TaxID=51655 RepID=A0A8S4FXD9_PLUXY|nr:unnamed protein product [Plutella xylostella]